MPGNRKGFSVVLQLANINIFLCYMCTLSMTQIDRIFTSQELIAQFLYNTQTHFEANLHISYHSMSLIE